MDPSFLGVPGVDVWLFLGLVVTCFVTTFLGATTGTAGGLALIAIMALFFPPAVLIPVHTIVQMGAGSSRAIIMWRYVLHGTLVPFMIGAAIGAAAGAQIFVTLSAGVIQGLIGCTMLVLIWAPRFSRIGGERRRFAVVGFAATFLGMFVSATGTLVNAFVAGASPDRRNLVATQGALMVIVHVAKLVAFGFLGMAIGAYWPLMAAMIAVSAVANWIGARVIVHVPEKAFRMVFRVVLSALAVRLLWVGARSIGLI